MIILEYIAHYYTALFELIGLFAMLSISAHLSKAVKKYTKGIIITLIVISIIHYAELYAQDIVHTEYIRAILTATKYTLYPFTLFIFLNITNINLE